MSAHVEWATAENLVPELLTRGDEADDGQKITHECGLDLGGLVIEGTRDELIELCGKALELLLPE